MTRTIYTKCVSASVARRTHPKKCLEEVLDEFSLLYLIAGDVDNANREGTIDYLLLPRYLTQERLVRKCRATAAMIRDSENACVSPASELRQLCVCVHPSSYSRTREQGVHLVKLACY